MITYKFSNNEAYQINFEIKLKIVCAFLFFNYKFFIIFVLNFLQLLTGLGYNKALSQSVFQLRGTSV